jgi:phosphomannomutase
VAGDAAGRVRRTTASLQALLFEAAAGGVVFAGASGGGYVFPEFLPAYDAVMSIGKVLEVVAHSGRPLSELVADLPKSAMVRTSVECPWSLKGTAMRRVIEATKGMHVDNRDGIKVWEGDGCRCSTCGQRARTWRIPSAWSRSTAASSRRSSPRSRPSPKPSTRS